MRKGYLVAQFDAIDTETFEKYHAHAGAFSAAFGGSYVARRAEPDVVDGEGRPKRFVTIAFDRLERVREFYNSPEYQAIPPHGLASTKGHVLLVTGAE